MKLTYIYHSAFCIETDNVSIIIDFYKDSKDVDGIVYDEILPKAKKLYVFCTHSHLDHYNGEVLNWKRKVDDVTYIFFKDILTEGMASASDAHYLDKLETYEDDSLFVKAYGSTDVGGSFYIEIDGLKIFHAGDLNNWHWNEESTETEIKEAEDSFEQELSILFSDVKELDFVMFPIDPRLGKDFMKGAEQFIEKLKVNLLAPMHFDEKYSKIEQFKEIALRHGVEYWGISKKGEFLNYNKK